MNAAEVKKICSIMFSLYDGNSFYFKEGKQYFFYYGPDGTYLWKNNEVNGWHDIYLNTRLNYDDFDAPMIKVIDAEDYIRSFLHRDDCCTLAMRKFKKAFEVLGPSPDRTMAWQQDYSRNLIANGFGDLLWWHKRSKIVKHCARETAPWRLPISHGDIRGTIHDMEEWTVDSKTSWIDKVYAWGRIVMWIDGQLVMDPNIPIKSIAKYKAYSRMMKAYCLAVWNFNEFGSERVLKLYNKTPDVFDFGIGKIKKQYFIDLKTKYSCR